MKLLSQLKNLKGKVVLVRVDWNVSSFKEARFINSIPTLKYLLKKGARIVILSHKGNPSFAKASTSVKTSADKSEGRSKKDIAKFSLAFLVPAIKKSLGQAVKFWAGDIGKLKNLKEKVILIENIRFYESKDKGSLAKSLADVADLFIFEAFSVAHHSAPSVDGVAKYLPTYAGLAFAEEVKFLDKLKKPKKPWAVILGGVKVSDKLKNIKTWLDQGAYLFLGGGVANTFLKAEGYEIGQSLFDKNSVQEARQLIKKYPDQIHWPDDVVIDPPSLPSSLKLRRTRKLRRTGAKPPEIIERENISKKDTILDLGPFTISKYTRAILACQTIFWVGSIAKTEEANYQSGSLALANFLGQAKKRGAIVVVGGGDTGAFLESQKLTKNVSYISTGGGAFLSYLSGEKWKILN